LESSAYGYRPGRDATDAVKEVHRLICRGYTDVVDADLSKYFDSIPHSALLASVARRIVDRHVLCLIKMWLKVPVEERSGDGKRRMSGGKSNTRGTPQGGVVRPMVVVLKLTRFRGHPNTYVQGAHDGEDKTTLHTGIPWPDGRAGYAPAARPRNRRCFGGRRKQLF
jgi:retron-type reverse transcriptase